MHWWNLAGTVLQDSRYALRWFRRELVLTGSIVVTLAFGIGLNTGVFSVLIFRSRAEIESAAFSRSSPARPRSPKRLRASSRTPRRISARIAPHRA